jgi:CheY-like chemotaxis protein
VLVVDDSITVRRVTQRLLQREGYRVALAADGLQALERLQAERPAVVLSDIEMPRMDGFDLVRNIRNDAALQGLPVIMITSRIAEKHREHARGGCGPLPGQALRRRRSAGAGGPLRPRAGRGLSGATGMQAAPQAAFFTTA